MTTSPAPRRHRWATRVLAVIATVLTVIGIGIATPVDAYAETYGVSVSASPSSTTTGNAITWTATNNSSGGAWVTLCTGWSGTLVAQNYVASGGSISHSITQSSATSETLVAFVPHENSCTESYNSSATGTWTAPSATTTTTTTAPSAVYEVSGSAANSKPAINTEDKITGVNTGNTSEHISLCISGDNSPIAEGVHSPGTSLTHDVTSATAKTQTYYLYAGPSYGCSGSSSVVTISWQNAVSVTVSPTNAGTTSGVKDGTTVAWDEAKTGDVLKVIETSHNGTKEFTTKKTTAMSSYSGSEHFYATETTPSGTQWVNDYKAVMYSSAGTVLTYAEFSFTWSGTSCTTDQITLSKLSSTELEATVAMPVCLPKGTNKLEVYWSADKPAPGQTIPLLTEVGSCTVGTGPTTLHSPKTCPVTPASPYNHGYYEAYLIEYTGGSKVVIACSGNVYLGVAPSGNVYALDLSASNPTPTVGQTITLVAANSTNANGATGNPEWLNICGTTGTTDQAAGYRDQGQSITHGETSSTTGTVNYIAYASGSKGCSGTEKRVQVTWEAKPTSHTAPALAMSAADYTPTIGQTDTITLTNTSAASEWLDYCGTSGTDLIAAGNHAPSGSLNTTVSSPSSAGDVTYHGWAGTSEGCSTVEESVTVDWQAAATTTTTTTVPATTTTTAPSGNSGTSGSTTTVPATTTTTVPATTTTVPATTTTTSGPPQYYPTAVYFGPGSGGGTVLDVASRRVRHLACVVGSTTSVGVPRRVPGPVRLVRLGV